MISDREALIKIGADASELNKATRDGAAGFNALADAGRKAGDVLADAGARVTSAAQAEGAAVRGVTSENAAAATARKAVADAQRSSLQAMRDARAEANMLRQANRQLAMQMTDVVTSVASGMPIWMVAIQQGGQIKDAYGGVWAALRGIAGLVTPAGVAIATVGAVALGLAVAAYQGASQSRELARGIALSGNAAAITEGQFNSLVASISNARDAARGDVRDMLSVLATGGGAVSTALDSASRASIALSKLNGESAAENARSFENMGDSVSAWAAKANKAYNYLTAEQYRQIMALEAQGRTGEAVRLNLEALAGVMEGRTVPALGWIERSLQTGSLWWSKWWDAAKGIGRPETIEDRIAQLQQKVAGFAKSGPTNAFARESMAGAATELEMLQREAARRSIRAADQAASQAAEQDAITQASRGFQDSLLAIQAAGSARLQAELSASLDVRQAAIERGYANFTVSGERYRDEMIAIERQRLAAEEAAAQKSIAIEAARVVKTEQEMNARNAAVVNAQARLAALAGQRAKLEEDIWRGAFDPKARNVSETPQAAFRQSELASYKQVTDYLVAQKEATVGLARAQAEYVRGLEQANIARGLANSRDLAGARLGDNARGSVAREAAITDRFNADKFGLDGDLANRRIARPEYEERLASLRSYYDAALAQEQAYQDARAGIEADATVGFDRAMANFAESARNQAAQSERAWTNAFDSMTDAVVEFTMTGKLNFAQFAKSALADLMKIWVRQQLMSAMPGLGGMFGGGAGAGIMGNDIALGFHAGGSGPGEASFSRAVPSAVFARAPRFHSGIGPGEMAAVLRKDESVLTPGQMRQLAPVGAGGPLVIDLDLKVINEGAPVQATARQTSSGGVELLLSAAKSSIAGDVASGTGDVYQAFKGRFNLRD